jgi:signal peptide peptidase SppA
MTYSRINQPHLIEQSALSSVVSKFAGIQLPLKAEDKKRKTTVFGDRLSSSYDVSGVQVIEVFGPLINGANLLERIILGATDHAQIISDVEAAVSAGKPIVLDINSPGGTVSGTAECADVICEASAKVPVRAFCGSLCGSAAYWIASQAKAGFFGSKGAMIGSIGAVTQLISISEMLKAAGIDARSISSSPLKSTGSPIVPITDESAAYMQDTINQLGAMFVAAVKSARPRVNPEALDGRVFVASEAKRLGLIDGLVSSLSDVIRLAGGNPAPNLSGSSNKAVAAQAAVDPILESYKWCFLHKPKTMDATPPKTPPELDHLRPRFDFTPIRSNARTITHSAESLAKAIGATAGEVAALIKSGKLPALKSQGNAFLFEIDAINQLSQNQ